MLNIDRELSYLRPMLVRAPIDDIVAGLTNGCSYICGRTATNYTQKSVNGSNSKLHEAVAVDVAAAGAGAAEGRRLLPSVRLMCNLW